LELIANFQKTLFAPVYEVHFVDRDNQVRDAQQRSQISVAPALFDDSRPCVHQHDGEVGGGSPGDHVARVLHVAGSVGNDEFTARCGEITIGHVNGNALFALGAETIGEIGKINLASAGNVRGALQCLELILHQAFGVIKETANQRGLAIIDRAASVEAQDLDRVVRGMAQDVEIFEGFK